MHVNILKHGVTYTFRIMSLLFLDIEWRHICIDSVVGLLFLYFYD